MYIYYVMIIGRCVQSLSHLAPIILLWSSSPPEFALSQPTAQTPAELRQVSGDEEAKEPPLQARLGGPNFRSQKDIGEQKRHGRVSRLREPRKLRLGFCWLPLKSQPSGGFPKKGHTRSRMFTLGLTQSEKKLTLGLSRPGWSN